ncbi:MAG: carboxynorspermidine decarboxylase [Campylobacterota bacterium]|nr:carboxynorspermidine decarboxylase [Campylobacterota bacterium]
MSEFNDVETPVFVCEMKQLEANLKLLDDIQDKSGVKILLALKGFALHESFSLISRYLQGASASSLNEARLAYEKFSKEVHTYSPAFKERELLEIAKISTTCIFNSLSQYHQFYPKIKEMTSCGLRINLEMSFDIPSHCNANRKQSRFGVLAEALEVVPQGLEGLHVHALCSQDSYALEEVIVKFEQQFSSELHKLKWLNLGGGHRFTCKHYNREHFISIMKNFQEKYPNLTLYVEPSEAIVHESGVLVATVLDLVHNEVDIAILDVSVEVHMTDVMLTKVSPVVHNAQSSGAYCYQLAGNSCAAGDVFGDYYFKEPLIVGDKIVFLDQMAYSMVKSTGFNGINPANIALKGLDGNLHVINEFSYEDYLSRL